MAAVIELRTGTALGDTTHGTGRVATSGAPGAPGPDAPEHAPRPAPALRLVHGGRSARARQLRRTYWLRRTAVLLGVLAVAWLGAQALTHALMPIDAGGGPTAQLGAVHQVQQGDTLWALATSIDPQADPRDVVRRIVELNRGGPALGADGSLLAGEPLRLPVGG